MDIEIIGYRYSHAMAKRSIPNTVRMMELQMKCPRPQEIARDRTELTSVQVHRRSQVHRYARGGEGWTRDGGLSLSLSLGSAW